MAVSAKEGQSSLEQRIIGVFQETRQVLDESRTKLPVAQNGLRGLKTAIGEFGPANLARLALGERPESVGASELDAAVGFVTSKRECIRGEIEIRDNVIAAIARDAYIEAQNALLEELMGSEQFWVSQSDTALSPVIRTHPGEGLKPVEGPVVGTLHDPHVEHRGFRIMPSAESAKPPTQFGYFATLLDTSGAVQLDLSLR